MASNIPPTELSMDATSSSEINNNDNKINNSVRDNTTENIEPLESEENNKLKVSENLQAAEEAFKNGRLEFSDSFSNEELKLLETLFRMVNVAADGLLSISELKTFLDQHSYMISNEEAQQIIQETDFDEDCSLSFREWLFLCKRADVSIRDFCPHSEGEPLSQDSALIRRIFQTIFYSIGFRPSIRESVEFFEHKIAEVARSSETTMRPSIPSLLSPRNKASGNGQNFRCTILHKFPNIGADSLNPVDTSETIDLKSKDDTVENLMKTEFENAHGGDTNRGSRNKDKTINLGEEDCNHHESYMDMDICESLNTTPSAYQEGLSTSDMSLTEYDYDLIVIGSGVGGSAAAKEAAKLGKRVAICDFMMPSTLVKSWSWRFGASCLNVGCVPKILMHHSGIIGELLDQKTSLPFGWFNPEENETNKAFTNNWSVLIDNIQNLIRKLNFEKILGVTHYKGIQYFNAQCEFEGPHLILVSHEDKPKEFLSGEKILIAVGSLYRYLDIPGAAGNCITVDDIFSQRNHPGKVLIVGGGPDAIECAGLLCALNIEVTIMSRSQVLKGYDRRMVTLILETLHTRGVKIMIGYTPLEIIRKTAVDTTTSRNPIEPNLTVVARHLQTGERPRQDYNTIILAIGKKPCTPLLKLEKAEILIDEKTSKIWVDSQDMTTMENVFAIGDCACGRPSGTPIAYQAGVTLTKRIFEGIPKVMEYDQVLPKFLLTPVPYSCVGLSEEVAIFEHGEPNIQVYHAKVHPLQYQLSNRYKDTYYAKLITLKTEDERVIGLHYLGPNAGEIIQGFTLAMKLKAKKSDLDTMIAIHPTCAEIFSKMTKTTSASAQLDNEINC